MPEQRTFALTCRPPLQTPDTSATLSANAAKTRPAESSNGASHDGESTNGKHNHDGTAAVLGDSEEVDRFGCTPHETAELDAFRRVLLDGRVSPEEAVWQWCAGDAPDIDPERLRKMWDMMVDAASRCLVKEHQATFLNIISVLLEVCLCSPAC